MRVLGTSRRAIVGESEFRVGSGSNNNLTVGDRFASRHHCTLLPRPDGLWVQDVDSRNGTWVNDLRVERCRVWPGARIRVGRTALELRAREEPPGQFGLIGADPALLDVIRLVRRLAASLKPVVVQGETGTGKEVVARALHMASPCRTHPFVPVNCSAIPRDLAESEFFGHVEGAFTGARNRKGAFECADGGTLFLDEVGEMPLELQPKLLRVLEDHKVQRIGDDRTRRVNVRVVAATNRDLAADASRGGFRPDLYHRLAVGVVRIPPLRERRGDVPLLVDHFLRQEAARTGMSHVPRVPDAVMEELSRQQWPGNVRQLRHAVERAVLEGQPELSVEDFGLEDHLFQGPGSGTDGMVRYRGRKLRDVHRDIYVGVLRDMGGNRTAAAASLGIARSTFFDQLKVLDISDT